MPVEAGVVSNSRNKIHQTWGPFFSPPLWRSGDSIALRDIFDDALSALQSLREKEMRLQNEIMLPTGCEIY